MAAPQDFGRAGEAMAAAALEAAGWRILDRNFRFGHREIDLVARKGRTVAFVEVKSRAAGSRGHPLEAITAAKRREIERVARFWIARHGRRWHHYRFDAVAVIRPARGPARIEHLADAWRIDG